MGERGDSLVGAAVRTENKKNTQYNNDSIDTRTRYTTLTLERDITKPIKE